MALVRSDLDAAAVAAPEHQARGWVSRFAACAQPGADGRPGGVRSPHPLTTGSEAVDNWPDGVQRLHPNHGAVNWS